MHLRSIRAFFYFREKGSLTNLENAAVALLLLGMLITVLCGGVNPYRLCHGLLYLPHWWSGVCSAMLLLGMVCSFFAQNKKN